MNVRNHSRRRPRKLRIESCEARHLLAGPNLPAGDAHGTSASTTSASTSTAELAASINVTESDEARFLRLRESQSIYLDGQHDHFYSSHGTLRTATEVPVLAMDWNLGVALVFNRVNIPLPEPVTPAINSIVAISDPVSDSPSTVPPRAPQLDDASASVQIAGATESDSGAFTSERASIELDVPRGEGGFEPLVAGAAFRVIPIQSDKLPDHAIPSHIVAATAEDLGVRESVLGLGESTHAHLASTTRSVGHGSSSESSRFVAAVTYLHADRNAMKLSPRTFSQLISRSTRPKCHCCLTMALGNTYRTASPQPATKTSNAPLSESADVSRVDDHGSQQHKAVSASAVFEQIAMAPHATHPAAFLLFIGVLWTQRNRELPTRTPQRWFGRRFRG